MDRHKRGRSNPKIAVYYQLPVERGVLVTAVVRNSHDLGIQLGNIIVRPRAIDINNVRDPTTVMNAHDVGDAFDTDLVRGNQRLSGQATLEKAPSAQLPSASPRHERSCCGGRQACAFLHRIGSDSCEGSLTRI